MSITSDTRPLLFENTYFMQRESYHTVSHFLDDTSFQEWVLTGSDQGGWSKWLSASPDKVQTAHEARNILLAIGGNQDKASETETEHALTHTWKRIHHLENRENKIVSGLWWKLSAAALLLGLGLSWYLFMLPRPQSVDVGDLLSQKAAKNLVEEFNNGDSPQIINLEDGSSVILQPGGRLTHSVAFDSLSREVYLSGEAFFEVSKDRRRPFLVYTDDIVTRVVGTSFRVKAIDGQPQVEVFVKTGEVNIKPVKNSQGAPQKEIALLPNESVSFVKESNVFEKSIVRDMPKRAVEYLTFEFVDTPVSKIFQTIETAYGLSIEYPESLLKDCYLSTSLSDEPLLEKLKIVCESLGGGSTFQMKEKTITIKSTGCN